MPSLYARRRKTTTGVRWHVRYRLGGRESREVHDSVWARKSDALARMAQITAAWVRGDPVPAVQAPERSGRLLGWFFDDYALARRDVSHHRHRTYRQARAKLGDLAGMRVDDLTPAHVRGWVGSLGLSAQTVQTYLGVLREVLDHAELEPNPARHKSVRSPRVRREEVAAPSTGEFRLLCEKVTRRHRPVLEFLEATGLRLGELRRLDWADVDLAAGRVRVVQGKSRAARRWVGLEPTVVARLEAVPTEDRVGLVFPGVAESTLRQAMVRAARFAEVAAYSPHDLRHRWISLLVAGGVPVTVISKVAGHSKASMTLDIYAHVLVDEDPVRLRALADAQLRALRGAALVRPAAVTTVCTPGEIRGPLGVHTAVGDTGLGSGPARG